MENKRWRLRILAIALLAALVCAVFLSGCGTGGTNSGGSAAAGGSGNGTAGGEGDGNEEESGGYVQGITDEEVLIANSAATSGSYAPVGVPFTAGLQGYIDMVNDAGGIDGRKITFRHQDDEFDPAKGSAALAEFVEEEKVFAIVGHFGTPVVAATVDQLKEYGIPAVYFATGIGQLYADSAATNEEGRNLFPVQPIYRTEGGIMAAFATAKFDAKKIGIIYTSDDAGMDFEKGAAAQIDSMDGIEYVKEQVPAGAVDVSAAVTSIKSAKVDTIIVGAIQGTMPAIVKELAAQSVNKDCITTYVNCSSAMSEAVVNDIKGKFDVYALGWIDYAADGAQQALADYQVWAPAEYGMNAYAQTGWIAGHFFTEGLRRLEGKEVTWDSYMKALQEAPIQNPFGGSIDYSDGKRLGTQEMNLSKVVPVSEEDVAGWHQVESLQSVETLLNQKGAK